MDEQTGTSGTKPEATPPVGRYRFVNRLAVGGMAEVFLATAVGTQGFEKRIVLKLLLPHLAAQPRFRTMFLDEARLTAELVHGNIVQVVDVGTLDDRPFLALEFVDGYDLRSVFLRTQEAGTQIPSRIVGHIASEVCRALDYAHRKKGADGAALDIVHRDVNPANIFLSKEGAVKLGDFGLAKARGNLDQSEVGVIKGKLSYLSPEQASDLPVDRRSDLFALGTTMYELACGRRPFEAESDYGVVEKVRVAQPEPPTSVNSSVDVPLEAIIVRAMARDPDDRYDTAAQMRDDLARYLQSLSHPPDDEELGVFVADLFAGDVRRQDLQGPSPGEVPLPPVMRSVTGTDGLSQYEPIESAPGVAVDAGEQNADDSFRPPNRRPLFVAGAMGLVACIIAIVVLATGGDEGKHEVGPVSAGGESAPDGELQATRTVLSVSTEPVGADVYLDGDLQGASPMKLDLALGLHTILLRAEGYEEQSVQYDAQSPLGERHIRLEELPANAAPKTRPRGPGRQGTLEIETDIVATVYIDGIRAGKTPGFKKKVPAGARKVELRPADGGTIHRARVEVLENDTLYLRPQLTPF